MQEKREESTNQLNKYWNDMKTDEKIININTDKIR